MLFGLNEHLLRLIECALRIENSRWQRKQENKFENNSKIGQRNYQDDRR
jgi:hypothetical protein